MDPINTLFLEMRQIRLGFLIQMGSDKVGMCTQLYLNSHLKNHYIYLSTCECRGM